MEERKKWQNRRRKTSARRGEAMEVGRGGLKEDDSGGRHYSMADVVVGKCVKMHEIGSCIHSCAALRLESPLDAVSGSIDQARR